MAVSKAPLSHQHEQNCVVLPLYHPAKDSCRRHIIIIVILFLIATLFYALWPSDPTLKIVRLHLNKIRVHTFPIVNVDISLHVTLKVRNVDAYSMDFTSLEVAVKYRGKKLGHARSGGGHVRALASSDLAAELEFSGVRVLSDVVALLEDLAKGKVPFDTVTEVTGKFGFLFFEFPLKVQDRADMCYRIGRSRSIRSLMLDNCICMDIVCGTARFTFDGSQIVPFDTPQENGNGG